MYGEFIEGALELIGHAFGRISDAPVESNVPDQPPVDETGAPELSPREQALATAIQERRNVSAETAESLVRWIRAQAPGVKL
jgi:hypothetical protein